ncbi:SDR family NAD(P)-dependent oxidoreductase [Amycolatopsis sp. TRM77291]
MELGISGKVAFVTGGSGVGIGASTCRELARNGAKVALTYRTNEEKGAALAEQIRAEGGEAIAVEYDLGQPETIDRSIAAVLAQWGAIDIFVANAMSAPAPMSKTAFEAVPREEIQRRLTTDLEAVLLTVQRVIPSMVERSWGRIVFVSSLGAERGWAGDFPFEVAAASAKAALTGAARSLGVEFGRRGVLTNVVTPGGVMNEELTAWLTPERLERLQARICTGRFSTPDELAKTITFLVSAANGNICGENVHVDGGS